MADTPADAYDGKTNEELSAELEARGLAKSGNKDELLARLREDDEKRTSGDGLQLGDPNATGDPEGVADANDDDSGGDDVPTEDTQPLGSLQKIERDRAEAEADERANVVEYEKAVYKNDDAALLLREIAEELGLTRPEDYAELTRLNGIDLNTRVDAGEEVRLPQQYSYVDVEHVDGGTVKE